MKHPAPTGFSDSFSSCRFYNRTLSEDVPHCLLKRPEPPRAMPNQPPVSDSQQSFAKRLPFCVFAPWRATWNLHQEAGTGVPVLKDFDLVTVWNSHFQDAAKPRASTDQKNSSPSDSCLVFKSLAPRASESFRIPPNLRLYRLAFKPSKRTAGQIFADPQIGPLSTPHTQPRNAFSTMN